MEDVLSSLDNIPVKFVPVGNGGKLWPWKAAKRAEIHSIDEKASNIECRAQYQ